MEEKHPFEGRPEEPDQPEAGSESDAASDRPPWELEPETEPGSEPELDVSGEYAEAAGDEATDPSAANRSEETSEPEVPPGPETPAESALLEPEPAATEPLLLEPETAPRAAAQPYVSAPVAPERYGRSPASPPPPSTAAVPAGLRQLLAVVLLIAGLLAIGSVALIAAGHLGDRFQMDRVAGMWTALASSSADEGLYPPLVDDETGRIGGTRAMPLAILLQRELANVVDRDFISGKVVTSIAAGVVALIALIILLARRCSLPASLVLLGIALVSEAGLVSAASIRAEPIALALQLLAIVSVAASRRAPMVLLAALFCAAAILTNISALWAPLAILLWLIALDRRQFIIFLLGFVVLLGVGVGAFHLVTDGRMIENLGALALAGVEGIDSFAEVFSGEHGLIGQGVGLWALLPLALLSVLLAAAQRGLTLYHVGLLTAVPVLILTLADSASSSAAMLDFMILAAICVGDLWRRAASAERRMTIAQAVVAMIIAWASVAAISAHAWPELRSLYARWSTGEQTAEWDPTPLAERIADDQTLLSEDPYLALSLDQAPFILDPWALARLDDAGNDTVGALAERIRSGGFDRIVLRERLEPISPRAASRRLGLSVLTAIEQRYEWQLEADGYHVYVPAKQPAAETPAQGE